MILTNSIQISFITNNQIATSALIAAALFVFFLLVVLAESVVLQLLGWGDLRQSLRSSTVMNLVSSPFVIISLALIPRLGLSGLLVSFLLSILFEGLALARLKKVSLRKSWWIATTANLASYLILILPTFLQSQ
jgi:hypothetical protein